MLIRLFDIQNGVAIPGEHCYTLGFLKRIMEEFPMDHLKIYLYLFYMTCPNAEMNPFFHLPEEEKEQIILTEIGAEFDIDEPVIMDALERCRQLNETPAYRLYAGIQSWIDKLATYLRTHPVTGGREGNITSGTAAASKLAELRRSYKDAYQDLMEEQKTTVRGQQSLGYDQM